MATKYTLATLDEAIPAQKVVTDLHIDIFKGESELTELQKEIYNLKQERMSCGKEIKKLEELDTSDKSFRNNYDFMKKQILTNIVAAQRNNEVMKVEQLRAQYDFIVQKASLTFLPQKPNNIRDFHQRIGHCSTALIPRMKRRDELQKKLPLLKTRAQRFEKLLVKQLEWAKKRQEKRDELARQVLPLVMSTVVNVCTESFEDCELDITDEELLELDMTCSDSDNTSSEKVSEDMKNADSVEAKKEMIRKSEEDDKIGHPDETDAGQENMKVADADNTLNYTSEDEELTEKQLLIALRDTQQATRSSSEGDDSEDEDD